MKQIFKKVLSIILSCFCIVSASACGDKVCSHNYTYVTLKEATCKETGINNYSCTICGISYMENTPKSDDHSYVCTFTKDATCKELGIKTFTCTICDHDYSEEIPKIGEHIYTVEVTKEATCKEDGIKTFTCKYCDDSYTHTIDRITTHSWQEATCIQPKTCSVCGETIGEPSATHSWQEATCMQAKTCSVCSETIGEPSAHIGKNQCDTCGINYYTELANYIKSNGTSNENISYIEYNVDNENVSSTSTILSLELDRSTGNIFLSLMTFSDQGNEIIFNEIIIIINISENLLDEHVYMYANASQNSYYDAIFGYISAKELTKNSSSLPYEDVSIEERADAPTVSDIQSDACKHLKLLLDLLNQFMKENNIKITTKNLGFENYSI